MDYDVMRRTQQTYSEKYKQYQTAIDAYNQNVNRYKGEVNAYNQAVKQWNAGPRTTPFNVPKPIEPSQSGVTRAEAEATKANPKFTIQQAQQLAEGRPPNMATAEGGLIRSILDKSNRNMPSSIEGALANVRRSI